MKYKKVVATLMLSTMTLNLMQQGSAIYAEEQTTSTTEQIQQGQAPASQQKPMISNEGKTTTATATQVATNLYGNIFPKVTINSEGFFQNGWYMTRGHDTIHRFVKLTNDGFGVTADGAISDQIKASLDSLGNSGRIRSLYYGVAAGLQNDQLPFVTHRTYRWIGSIENLQVIQVGEERLDESNVSQKKEINKTFKVGDDHKVLFWSGGSYYASADSKWLVSSLQMEYAEQWKQIDDLFTSIDHTSLAPNITGKMIEDVQSIVDSIVNNADKVEMNAALQKAKTFYDEQIKYDKTKTLVDDLFATSAHKKLADGVDQSNINTAREAVDGLPESDQKKALEALVEKAQTLYTGKLEDGVHGLFTSSTFTGLVANVTQEQLDALRAKVNELPTGATTIDDTKEEL
ncbi:toxin Cry1Ac domain D-VI-related protein [Enterococcus lactis]|uniref:toxin Cry1Ac domain D-VI-related protein n=1 Tax=Enterococcus lactis TaxID=357441 RepID=UPI004043712F